MAVSLPHQLFYDGEFDIFMQFLNYYNNTRINARTIRPRVDMFNYFSDWEFVKRYRMDKNTAMVVFDDIEAAITPNSMRNNAMEPLNKFLITLRFYATGALIMVIGDLAGISETAARSAISETTKAIASLRPKYVCVPLDLEELKKKFYAIAKFPNVIMAIDCTHVRIKSPGGDDAEVFRNRKGYFSLNVQTVCDAELRILDCVARWPGSTHDQRIFNNSKLMSNFERGQFGSSFIVGDSGYENRPYLLTPLPICSNTAENLYNESIIRTRNPAKRSYGVMKSRFPVLSTGIRCSLSLTMAIIHAVVVLHNVALNDPLPRPEIEVESYNDAKVTVGRIGPGNGDIIQNRLISDYFARMR